MPLDPPLDLSTLPGPVQRVLGTTAPAPMRLMAARGAAPGLKPDQVLVVIAFLALEALPHVEPAARDAALATLDKLPAPIVNGALGVADLPAGIVDLLASKLIGDLSVVERIVAHPSVTPKTIEHLAKAGSEAVTELVAVNEELLLRHTSIIEALYMNRNTRMSTADRVLDLAVRNGKELKIPAFKEAAEAIKDEIITAPDVAPTPDDLLFKEAQALAAEIDAKEIFKEDAEGNEELDEKAKPLEQRIRDMTVSQKVRAATLGTAAARAILVRDKNRIVAQAVVRSPMIQEVEIALIASSRSVSDDVLRIIAANGEWTKSHQIKFNLVGNPKTPLSMSLRLLPHLRADELKKLARSKNVSAQISKFAKMELDKKKV